MRDHGTPIFEAHAPQNDHDEDAERPKQAGKLYSLEQARQNPTQCDEPCNPERQRQEAERHRPQDAAAKTPGRTPELDIEVHDGLLEPTSIRRPY
ncbi:hypothetical protein [Bradyrhizobium sp. USDA 10063]